MDKTQQTTNVTDSALIAESASLIGNSVLCAIKGIALLSPAMLKATAIITDKGANVLESGCKLTEKQIAKGIDNIKSARNNDAIMAQLVELQAELAELKAKKDA